MFIKQFLSNQEVSASKGVRLVWLVKRVMSFIQGLCNVTFRAPTYNFWKSAGLFGRVFLLPAGPSFCWKKY